MVTDMTRESVLAGMVWLDEHAPGWVEKIDLDTLELAHPKMCVLGQVYGDYGAGMDVVFPQPDPRSWDAEAAEATAAIYGFTTPLCNDDDDDVGEDTWMEARDAEWAELTETWREALAQRKGQAGA
jgi:hypothetical protein